MPKVLGIKRARASMIKSNASRKTRLNNSRYDLLSYYEEITPEEFERRFDADVDWMFGDPETVGYPPIKSILVAKDEYFDTLSSMNVEYFPKLEDGTIVRALGTKYPEDYRVRPVDWDSVQDAIYEYESNSTLNASKREKDSCSGVVIIYQDFEELPKREVEKLIRDRVRDLAPGTDIKFKHKPGNEIKVIISAPDTDAEQEAKLALESSDVVRRVNWERNEEDKQDTDAGCHRSRRKTNASLEEDRYFKSGQFESVIKNLIDTDLLNLEDDLQCQNVRYMVPGYDPDWCVTEALPEHEELRKKAIDAIYEYISQCLLYNME